jgi:ABC-type Zn uptake system ZnuABC Zn-binding protein ZnuA
MLVHDSRWLAALCLMLAWCAHASAAPVPVVVSFSILEDIVRRIGGGEVVVTSLIGPDSDAHVFEPNPDQARLAARASRRCFSKTTPIRGSSSSWREILERFRGPPLYSHALSRPNGPAPTYIRMIEYNTAALKQGMLKN